MHRRKNVPSETNVIYGLLEIINQFCEKNNFKTDVNGHLIIFTQLNLIIFQQCFCRFTIRTRLFKIIISTSHVTIKEVMFFRTFSYSIIFLIMIYFDFYDLKQAFFNCIIKSLRGKKTSTKSDTYVIINSAMKDIHKLFRIN